MSASSTNQPASTASASASMSASMSATSAASSAASAASLTGERADLLAALAQARHFLRYTTRDLTEEQAAARPSASELCLGGLIKHVASSEENWARFIVEGPASMEYSEELIAHWSAEFRMQPGETLAGVLDHYAEIARRTDELVATLPDLEDSHPLPEAPWFAPGTRWTARRALLHIVAETTQHAGHADIIRESLDGAKTMG